MSEPALQDRLGVVRNAASQVAWRAEETGFDDRLSLEIPRGSGVRIVARLAVESDAVLLLAALDIVPETRAAFAEASPADAFRALDDLAAYICTFDVEYEFDLRDHAPWAVQLAARWHVSEGVPALVEAARLVLRARQGCHHKLRFWHKELVDGRPGATAASGAPPSGTA